MCYNQISMKNKLNILFEDKHLIIVYKRRGIPTIKSDKYKYNLYSDVYDYLHKKNQKVFVIHRLDSDTSGIVIFAKSEKVKELLQNNWSNVLREYLAVVHNNIKDYGVIESYLKETKTLYTYSTKDKSGKYAKTNYKKLDYKNNLSLVKINIETGRKNQIRVHMSDNNTPILGDKKYGIKDNYRNMMLLANRFKFNHPITKELIDIDLGIPNEYSKLFK